MLSSAPNRDPARVRRSPVERSPARNALDAARRDHYLTLLRRWAQERLPTGTRAATDAAEWIREVLTRSGNADGEAGREGGSLLVKLRTHLLAERPPPPKAQLAERPIPCSRVAQLIGCHQLDAWESALAILPRRQRELVILRVEFGLDFEAIAAEMHLAVPFARAETVNALAALIDALGGTPRGRAA